MTSPTDPQNSTAVNAPDTFAMSRVSSTRAALMLAFGLALLHMPSGLPAPLYPFYQRTMGISSATVSMLFATYVVGVLIGLAIMPSLIGNRHVLVGACGLSIVADLMFLTAHSAAPLFGGHLLQGVVLGLFTGVVPVLLAEIDTSGLDRLAGRITTSANAVGLAAGPLWSGFLLWLAPWPGRFVWIVQIAATIAIAPFMRVPRGLGVSADSKAPLKSVLASVFRGFSGWAALLAGFCAFASGGLLASLGSVVLNSLVGVRNSAIEGLVVSLCFILSAIAGGLKVRGSVLRVTTLGLAWVAAGSVALIASAVFTSVTLMAVGAVLCGIGQGLGLQGATQLIAGHSDHAYRGRSISLFFVWCYLGTTVASFGVGGVLTVTGLRASFDGFSGAVVMLCAVGMLCGLLGRRWSASSVEG